MTTPTPNSTEPEIGGLVERLKKVRNGFLSESDFERREAAELIKALLRAQTEAETKAAEDAKRIGELVEALRSIVGLAVCYGMRADEAELRHWLQSICETGDAALAQCPGPSKQGSNHHG